MGKVYDVIMDARQEPDPRDKRIRELEEQLAQAIRLVSDYGDQLKAWADLLEKQTKVKRKHPSYQNID